MTNQEIINYVQTSPNNTNPYILNQMLDELAEDSNIMKIFTYDVETEELDTPYDTIKQWAEDGFLITAKLVNISDYDGSLFMQLINYNSDSDTDKWNAQFTSKNTALFHDENYYLNVGYDDDEGGNYCSLYTEAPIQPIVFNIYETPQYTFTQINNWIANGQAIIGITSSNDHCINLSLSGCTDDYVAFSGLYTDIQDDDIYDLVQITYELTSSNVLHRYESHLSIVTPPS